MRAGWAAVPGTAGAGAGSAMLLPSTAPATAPEQIQGSCLLAVKGQCWCLWGSSGLLIHHWLNPSSTSRCSVCCLLLFHYVRVFGLLACRFMDDQSTKKRKTGQCSVSWTSWLNHDMLMGLEAVRNEESFRICNIYIYIFIYILFFFPCSWTFSGYVERGRTSSKHQNHSNLQ